MYIATLETRSYSFIAAGSTENQARDVLRLGWLEHQAQTGAENWDAFADGVVVQELGVGDCLRDGYNLMIEKGN